MPQAQVVNMQGEKVREVQLSDAVFAAPVNHNLIHQALVTIEKSLQRRPGRCRTRGQVDTSKAKIYAQKGTGRARHGSRNAPTFVGGGKAHGPTGVLRHVSMPRRMRRQALYGALSAQYRDGLITILDKMALPEIRTKQVVEMLGVLGAQRNALLLLGPDEAFDDSVYLSCRNVRGLVARPSPHISVRDVLKAHSLIITTAALEMLQSGEDQDADA